MSTNFRLAALNDIEPLLKIAEADQHSVIRPTHVIEKNGELSGYLSIASVPMVIFYLHTQRCKARDSLAALQFVEQECRKLGSQQVCIPCNKSSNLFKYMERVGCVGFGQHEFFLKPL